jgi:protein-disulfide isomerase
LKNTPALRLLLAKGADVDAANRNDITPLIAAAQTGNTEAVTLLLDAGAAPDRADNLGWTALMWAAYRNDEATIRVLLDRGADAARVSRDGKSTALGLAKNRGASASVIAALEAKSRGGGAAMTAARSTQLVAQPADRRRDLKPAHDPERVVRGNPNAAITIYEYTDFQCPYCAQGTRTVDEVLARYEGQVRLIVKHLPLPLLHPAAMACAMHFEALALQGPDKAWGFYDRIFADQRALSGGDAYLQKVAAELGADVPRLQQDLRSETVRTRVAADLKEAERFQFDGVPAFVIGGTAIEGAQPAETFFVVIDAILSK